MYFKSVQEEDAKGLYYFCENDGSEIVISHSNGSLVTQNALQRGLKIKQWFSFAGAASSDKVFYSSENFDYATSIYNPHDFALKIGSWLPKHPFGKLGYKGYRGAPDGTYDERWKNVNGASSGFGLNYGHYFDKELHQWAEFLIKNIETPRSMAGIDRYF